VNPRIKDRAMVLVGNSLDGSAVAIVSTPSGMTTPKAAPNSNPVPNVDNLANVVRENVNDSGSMPTMKEDPPSKADIASTDRNPLDMLDER